MARAGRSLAIIVAAAVVLAGTVGGVLLWHRHGTASRCTVTVGAATYELDLEQAQEAATIAAVGLRDGAPDHAVTIALAAALQESKLLNLTYGDRDSVGVFQQRPSQGWGTRSQLLDPMFAADAFYRRLLKVPGWRTMPVADAAQRVQRSASGAAYAQWEGESRALARALTGEVPAALSCHFAKPDPAVSASRLETDVAAQFGRPVLGVPLTRGLGRAVAAWLVAKAHAYGIRSVSFDGATWTNSSGRWRPTTPVTADVRWRTGRS